MPASHPESAVALLEVPWEHPWLRGPSWGLLKRVGFDMFLESGVVDSDSMYVIAKSFYLDFNSFWSSATAKVSTFAGHIRHTQVTWKVGISKNGYNVTVLLQVRLQLKSNTERIQSEF